MNNSNNFKKTVIKDTFSEIYEKFNKLSDEIKRYILITKNYRGVIDRLNGEVIIFNENDEVLKCTWMTPKITYASTHCYVKRDIQSSITIDKKHKKIYYWFGKNFILDSYYELIFNYLNIDWYKNIPQSVFYHCLTETMLKKIIFNEVTNPEKFYKAYMSISLKINKKSNISWKLIRDALNINYNGSWYKNVSIQKIISCTTNPNLALKKYINCNDDENINLFKDILVDAEILGVKINPNWSVKRMQAEHTKMTENINKILIASKSNNIIPYKEIENINYPNKSVNILKSDMDVYNEGTTMHHCLYTSYYSQIVNKEYFAFSAYYPERCTIGVKYNPMSNKFILDQIYKKFDQPVMPETKEYFEDWINSDNMQLFFAKNYYLDIFKVNETLAKRSKIIDNNDVELRLDNFLGYTDHHYTEYNHLNAI